MKYRVKDLGLAQKGFSRIQWAEREMKVLRIIQHDFQSAKPLRGLRIGACLHVTAETAVLAKTLKAGGAEVFLCASNPLSTQDDVAASLVKDFDIPVFAIRGDTTSDYYGNIQEVIDYEVDCTIDDGCDLVFYIHKNWDNVRKKPQFGLEETTTGVIRLRALEASRQLKYPILAVNESFTKFMFDNRYGTGQSVIDGVLRATNYLLAGKVSVVCGYGWCGKGIARRLSGLGSRVRVCEVDPVKALEAVMDGFEVGKLENFVKEADIIITATGNSHVVSSKFIKASKDGAIFANAGHFDIELELDEFKDSLKQVEGRPEVYELQLEDKTVFILGQGRLVNLACAEGHPPSVMDLSFANQALGIEYMSSTHKSMEPKVFKLPDELDRKIAKLKLQSLGIDIDHLTAEQEKYLRSFEIGT
ncbi:MAG: adenosylhomocysteinase [Deltaproteobacteria bacterium]|nr:adenosylhomocysteinase [Deltaproteobacteria bacterium]